MKLMTNGLIRHFTYYFRRMMKFHDLKVQGVPQVLFILLLAVSFGARIIAQPLVTEMSIYQQQLMMSYSDILSTGNMTDPAVMENLMKIPFSEEYAQFITLAAKVLGLFLLQQVLMMLVSFFYLGAFLVDLEEGKTSVAHYINKFLTALPRYIGFNFLFYLALAILAVAVIFGSSLLIMMLPLLSILLFLLPVAWFLVEVLFIFKDITLLDTRVGIIKNFRLSWKLTAGNRLMIGRNIFFIVFLNMIISMVGVGTNLLLSMFVVSFLEVIVLLIRQRLTALMYFSRTRIEKKKGEEG